VCRQASDSAPTSVIEARFRVLNVGSLQVLVDAKTGGCFTLTPEAAEILRSTIAPEGAGLPTGLDRRTALHDRAGAVNTLINAIEGAAASPPPRITFAREGESWVLRRLGNLLATVDADRKALRIAETESGRPMAVLRLLAPRLMSLHGHPVLHASCVAGPQGTLAFTGESGAGKTTTALAAQHATSAQLISEDMLLLGGQGTETLLRPSAEAKILAWIDEASRSVIRPETVLDYQQLLAVTDERPTVTLTHTVLLDRRARRGLAIDWAPLERIQAFGPVLRELFAGRPTIADLEQRLQLAYTICSTTTVLSGFVPEGLDALRNACVAQRATTALKVLTEFSSTPSQA